jgi:RNA polymerase sigma factor (sigma-70 family)
MTQRPWNSILDHIRSLAARRDSPAGDAELLLQFVSHNDESAFESLLRRHGPMVLRVAHRIVGNETDAEDVFQATFLLLARRAGSIRKRESVASWLHGVAHRLALSARGRRARRQEREREAAAIRSIESSESAWNELEETLHEVLAQLPAKYRTPLVYCYLEGWTQEEVARQLGKPLGTVRGWLARGRELLRKRLQNRGISLSGEGASAALLASACATAEAVPMPLRIATLQSAHLFATGGNVMTLISPSVAALVKKGLTAVLIGKLKSGAAGALALALLVMGTSWAAHRTFRANPPSGDETTDKTAPKQAAPQERPRTDSPADPLPPGAVARLGNERFGHEGWIHQFALSPDGRTIAAVARKSAAFWDFATGRLTQRLAIGWDMHCLVFAPDGKSAAVGGEDCIVHIFDIASGKELRRLVGHQPGKDRFVRGILGASFTPDGNTLLTWGIDETIRFWDTRSGKALRQIDGKGWIVRKLSPDGKFLAIQKTGAGQILHLVDVATVKEVRQLTQSGDVSGVAFSPDEKILAVACGAVGKPGRITLWEPASGQKLGTLTDPKDAVFALAFSPDSKVLASAGYGKTIRLWDLATKKEIREALPLPNPVYELSFSRDGKTLISSGPETRVRLWDAAILRERFPTDAPQWAITAIAYAQDGKTMALSSNNQVWLWSPSTGKVLRTLQGQEGSVSALNYSLDGKSLITGSYDGTLRFWDSRTGKEQRRISIGKGWVQEVALSPDGKMLAVWGEATSRKTIHLLNAVTGAKLRTIEASCDDPGVVAISLSLRFSPDSKTLYARNGNHTSILRWVAATGEALPLIGKHDGGLSDIAVCCDGRSIVAATLDASLYLWETASGQRRLFSKDAGRVDTVAFSPDGRWLAVANAGTSFHLRGNEIIPQGVETREQVRLIRVADGKVIRRFTGHLGGIGCLSFSPDGRTLASGGHDSTVLVWDVSGLASSDEKKAPPLKSEKLAELWKGMGGSAADAHGCMWQLISSPSQSVAFLDEKLKPIVAVDAERFARLLKKLDSDQFREREEATQELKKLGKSAESALRKALQEKPSLETRRRLEALLSDLEGDERLRSLRAIEVLERINDKSARHLLRRLAEGAAGAWLTEEARLSLRRLEQRDR